jgi:hypothetical protein
VARRMRVLLLLRGMIVHLNVKGAHPQVYASWGRSAVLESEPKPESACGHASALLPPPQPPTHIHTRTSCPLPLSHALWCIECRHTHRLPSSLTPLRAPTPRPLFQWCPGPMTVRRKRKAITAQGPCESVSPSPLAQAGSGGPRQQRSRGGGVCCTQAGPGAVGPTRHPS